MEQAERYYIVHENALPRGLKQVCEVRSLLIQGRAKNITEAVKAVGISRSEYYKYRDSVEVYTKEYQDNIITLQAVLTDRAGVLSSFLNTVARAGGNVLTVNQNIPVDGAAGITLSVNTADMRLKIETLMKRLLALDGVQSASLLQGHR
ncbi:MAG: ACT domain-containing protein [Clostridia bacterium]|nr:ACT domain-containing protein [Clostridia bacterium]